MDSPIVPITHRYVSSTSPEKMERQKNIVSVARTFLGTKWHHCGRKRGVGVDCAGLLIKTLQECRYPVADIDNYTGFDEFFLLEDEVRKYTNIVSSHRLLQPGDILLFRSRGIHNHCAFFTEPMKIIHAYQDMGSVVEHNMGKIWWNTLHSVHRMMDLFYPENITEEDKELVGGFH